MILASFEPYFRQSYRYTQADHFGASVSQHDLLEHALTAGIVDGVHVFVDPNMHIDRTPVNEFNAGLGRIGLQVLSLDTLATQYKEQDYVVLCRGSQFNSLTHMRLALDLRAFSICSILHAAHWPTLMSDCVSLLLTAQPFDVFVVTSCAGRRTLQLALQTARNLLRDRGCIDVEVGRVNIASAPLGMSGLGIEGLDKAAARRLLHIPQDCRVLLWCGRISEFYKADLDPLLMAFRQCCSTAAQPIHLVIAGQDIAGQYSSRVKNRADTLNLSGNVVVSPNVSPQQKALLFAAADIFVSPVDNIQETYGLSILEAMATGLPVVASDWSGYRELVDDGVTGFLIPTWWSHAEAARAGWKGPYVYGPAAEASLARSTVVDVDMLVSKLSLLLNDSMLRSSMGRAGFDRFQKKYSWDIVIQQFGQLWADLNTLRKTCGPTTTAGRADYDALFNHFATESMDESWVIEPAFERLSCLGAQAEKLWDEWAPDTISILRSEERSQKTLGQLREQYGRQQTEVLLKKGLLRRVTY